MDNQEISKDIRILDNILNMPSCIVKSCPNKNSAAEIMKIISEVGDKPSNSVQMMLVEGQSISVKGLEPSEYYRNLEGDKVKYHKMLTGVILAKTAFTNPLSAVVETEGDIRLFAIQEVFNFSGSAFDKELWTILKDKASDGFTFIGFTQVETVSELKLKSSLSMLEVYDFDVFMELISGDGVKKEDKTDKQISPVVDYDNMTDGHSFEKFCADLLKKNGFENIVVTSGSGDQGIDILCRKEDVKYGIQCKCYSKDIGNKAVQEAYAGAQFYNCHVPVVLTNRDFTPAARSAAEKTNVVLWGRQKLDSLIKNAEVLV